MSAVMLPHVTLLVGPCVLMEHVVTTVRSEMCWTLLLCCNFSFLVHSKNIKVGLIWVLGFFRFFFFLRSWLWEHHAESLLTPVIFLNIVMAQMNFVQMTSISWMAYPVKTILRTAMKDAARHTIISADISSHQVDPVIIYYFFMLLVFSNVVTITRQDFSDFSCSFFWILFLFLADNAIKAADICFQDANMQGDRFGSCGINSNGNYIKCTLA